MSNFEKKMSIAKANKIKKREEDLNYFLDYIKKNKEYIHNNILEAISNGKQYIMISTRSWWKPFPYERCRDIILTSEEFSKLQDNIADILEIPTLQFVMKSLNQDLTQCWINWKI